MRALIRSDQHTELSPVSASMLPCSFEFSAATACSGGLQYSGVPTYGIEAARMAPRLRDSSHSWSRWSLAGKRYADRDRWQPPNQCAHRLHEVLCRATLQYGAAVTLP